MKVYEPEVYAKHIAQPWDIQCTCLFKSNLNLSMLVVIKIFPKVFKIFQNPPATQQIKLQNDSSNLKYTYPKHKAKFQNNNVF